MPLSPGTSIGDCEILAPIAAGGMGEVYRARDNALGREVAVKVLPEGLAADPDRLRRFEQEARAAAALNHPNILTVYRFGTTDGHTPYLVTELLQGQTLRERLQQSAIPARKVIDYGLQIARGLSAAHERGILHRDLKPENLFLTRDGVIKILDFGLAKLTRPDPSESETLATVGITEPGLVMGTAGYMSPEQVRGQTVSARSDIFGLGTILYEMISGKQAFSGGSRADIMTAILKEEPPELAANVANLPPALARIVHRCMEKDPAERFQTARDLAFNLELLTRDGSGSSPAAAVSSKQGARWLRPTMITLAILAASAVGFLAARSLRPKVVASAPVTLRRLTDFVGMEEFPALSPDGKSLAFTADVSGKRQVWVRLLSGGTPLQITHDDVDHQSPRWLSDSAALIYFTPSDNSDQGQVWEIPALGGTARPVVSSLIPADVSHDGNHLAYLRAREGKIELVVGDREGTSSQAVAKLTGDFRYSNLRWSPDDHMLAYQGGRTFDFDVYSIPASGGEPKRITHDGNPENGFSWLPDSSGVVFSSARGSTVLYMPVMNLWSVRLGGQELRQLTFGETSYGTPDVDRNGNIATARARVEFNIWKFPRDGSPEQNVQRGTQVTRQTGTVQTPSVSPDDKELAYLTDSGGHGNIWILNMQTGMSRQLTFEQNPQITLGVPVWSPDGQHISYVVRGKAGWNVDQWVVNTDGTGAHKVADGGGWACWSADGRWLYYSPPTETGFRIEKSYADGSNRVEVQPAGEKPAVAADGTLYYTINLSGVNGVADMELRVAHPDNATGRAVARIAGARLSSVTLVMQPVLSPDGKWLAMLLTDGPSTNIWLQPTDGGELRRMTDFGRQATFMARRVSFSPDGKFIYAAVGKGEADIVLLSNVGH